MCDRIGKKHVRPRQVSCCCHSMSQQIGSERTSISEYSTVASIIALPARESIRLNPRYGWRKEVIHHKRRRSLCDPVFPSIRWGGFDGSAVFSGLRERTRVNPYLSPLPRARALMARPWSARCYGVARQREGSRQNSKARAIADQSPLLKSLRRVRFQRTSTRQQLDCAKTL
jgi:hypothetical protein